MEKKHSSLSKLTPIVEELTIALPKRHSRVKSSLQALYTEKPTIELKIKSPKRIIKRRKIRQYRSIDVGRKTDLTVLSPMQIENHKVQRVMEYHLGTKNRYRLHGIER
jgi:hypothetical protein